MNKKKKSSARSRKVRWTEEFFRRLVECSMEAVVAVDRKGKILIFNEAAEKISGYRAEEVINRMSVETIYPPGVAREIMRQLRSPEGGGEGKIRDKTIEIITREGQRIPISLSGAVVYDQGEEVATIGFFMDLREKLRLQKQVAEIDGKLAEREREAALAELAGALAHELNQPLTIINSRIYMAEKMLKENDQVRTQFKYILEELERMSNIVRQIGRVTSYETKSYAGRAQIIDIGGSGKKEVDVLEDFSRGTKEADDGRENPGN